MPRASSTPLTLRPARESDRPFLSALYAGTRAAEMARTGWPPETQAVFLQGQFDAQDRSYRQQFPGASFDVVLAAGKPVGRLYVARRPEAVHVMEITLDASCRGRGWGTGLLRGILAEADRLGLPVRLHVEGGNRARRLYLRLGFRQTGSDGHRLAMERPARGG